VGPSLASDALKIIIDLQGAIDTWEKGLRATCGSVVPEKWCGGLLAFNGQEVYGDTNLFWRSLEELFINNINGIKKLGSENETTGNKVG